MARKKKKLTKEEIAKQLKRAKRVEKSLSDYKKNKDKTFRKHASEELLLPSSDLNTEIRKNTQKRKSKKSEIEAQQNRISALQRDNRKIQTKINDLKNEYAFADDERKREIDKLLKSPDYRKRDLSNERNLLNYLQNKDFDYVINDGFKKYKINTRELKKYWKSGQDATLPILKKMQREARVAVRHFDNLIKKEKNTATRARMKKLKRIRDGLKNKLQHTIDKNIDALESGNMNVLDEYNEQGEKAYSILFRVVGFSIDKATP